MKPRSKAEQATRANAALVELQPSAPQDRLLTPGRRGAPGGSLPPPEDGMAALVALPGVGALLVQGLEQHQQQRIFQFPEDECRRDDRAPSHRFTPDEAQVAEKLNLVLETAQQLSLSGLLLPLFLLEPDRHRPPHASGIFARAIRLSGTYDGRPGWSRSANGEGRFRIEQGAVAGSTGLAPKASTMRRAA